MDADLMGSASMKNRFDQRRSAQALDNAVRSSRGSPHVFIYRHALAMRRMPRNRRPNFTTLPLNFAAYDRVISFIHASARELRR